MHLFVIVLTKNNPVRRRYILDADLTERWIEEQIPNFRPYSRVVYVSATTELDAQRTLFDYMRQHGIVDFSQLEDGIVLETVDRDGELTSIKTELS
jgi:hypothetical protein